MIASYLVFILCNCFAFSSSSPSCDTISFKRSSSVFFSFSNCNVQRRQSQLYTRQKNLHQKPRTAQFHHLNMLQLYRFHLQCTSQLKLLYCNSSEYLSNGTSVLGFPAIYFTRCLAVRFSNQRLGDGHPNRKPGWAAILGWMWSVCTPRTASNLPCICAVNYQGKLQPGGLDLGAMQS